MHCNMCDVVSTFSTSTSGVSCVVVQLLSLCLAASVTRVQKVESFPRVHGLS